MFTISNQMLHKRCSRRERSFFLFLLKNCSLDRVLIARFENVASAFFLYNSSVSKRADYARCVNMPFLPKVMAYINFD